MKEGISTLIWANGHMMAILIHNLMFYYNTFLYKGKLTVEGASINQIGNLSHNMIVHVTKSIVMCFLHGPL